MKQTNQTQKKKELTFLFFSLMRKQLKNIQWCNINSFNFYYWREERKGERTIKNPKSIKEGPTKNSTKFKHLQFPPEENDLSVFNKLTDNR